MNERCESVKRLKHKTRWSGCYLMFCNLCCVSTQKITEEK